MNVYLERDNQQFGPFSEAQARQHIAEGRFRIHDRGWIEGMPAWKDISEIPQLWVRSNSLQTPAPPVFGQPNRTAIPYPGAGVSAPTAKGDLISIDSHEAGFWRRSAALMIDAFLIVIALGILSIPLAIFGFNGFGAFGTALEFSGLAGTPESWLGALLMAGYFAFWHSSPYAATPGKMLFGCVTLSAETHQPIALPQAIIREIARIIAVIPFGLSYWFQPFTARRQTLHDMVAGSVVLRKSADSGAPGALAWVVNLLGVGLLVALVIVAFIFLLF